MFICCKFGTENAVSKYIPQGWNELFLNFATKLWMSCVPIIKLRRHYLYSRLSGRIYCELLRVTK